jgi:hypothetical protein
MPFVERFTPLCDAFLCEKDKCPEDQFQQFANLLKARWDRHNIGNGDSYQRENEYIATSVVGILNRKHVNWICGIAKKDFLLLQNRPDKVLRDLFVSTADAVSFRQIYDILQYAQDVAAAGRMLPIDTENPIRKIFNNVILGNVLQGDKLLEFCERVITVYKSAFGVVGDKFDSKQTYE